MKKADMLLLIAVLASLVVALGGIATDPGALPGSAVALVNGKPIDRSSFDAYVTQVATQFRRTPGERERAEVLARLIDEELLLQQGLALDLPRKDSRLRAQIVQEVIRQAIEDVARQPVDERELRAFFEQARDYFRGAPSYRVAQFDCRDTHAAQELVEAIAGGRAPVLPRAGVVRNTLLPDAWLGEGKLRDYLGARRAAQIAGLEPGTAVVSAASDGRAGVLWLVDMRAAPEPSFGQIRAQVETEFRRRRDEAALQAHVARLRKDARLVFASPGA